MGKSRWVGELPASVSSDSGWLAVSYNANWADFGTVSSVDYRRGQYQKVGNRVRCVGSVKRTSGSTLTPFTLPSGYRPPRAIVGLFNSNGASNQVVLGADGILTFTAAVTNQIQSFDFTFDTDELT